MLKNGNNLKSGLWCLSNVAAGTDSHKESILLADSLPSIYSFMTNEYPNELRKEACMVITNFLTTTENEDFKMMVANFDQYKVISLLIECLQTIDNNLTLQILEALDHLFSLDRLFEMTQE